MLIFEVWPPEVGRVKLMNEAINSINTSWDAAQIIGRYTGLLLSRHSDSQTAQTIVDELVLDLRNDYKLECSIYPAGTPRELFSKKAKDAICLEEVEAQGVTHV